MDQVSPPTSAHVEETVDQLGRMYDDHQSHTSSLQRLANNVTAGLAKPVALISTLLLILAYIVANYLALLTGVPALESFPFPYLEFVATVAALLVALLILTTQRHEDQLAEKRARLTLQIATLSEKKIAKVIELLRDQRRDNPLLPARDDRAAKAMATPTDAGSELVDR